LLLLYSLFAQAALVLSHVHTYYWWSINNPSKLLYKKFIAEGPEIVVLDGDFATSLHPERSAIPLAEQLTGLEYHNTHNLCGGVVRPGRAIQEWECDVIYERGQGNPYRNNH
jgi:hypothetical protein